MDFEEDTYSKIFLALKHPIRRKIIRILDESPALYTDILNELRVETGLLNYHLESLKELVNKKENGRYTLSTLGEAAIDLTKRVEEPVKRESQELKFLNYKLNSLHVKASIGALMVGIIIFSFLYVDLLYQSEVLREELDILTSKYIRLVGIQEFINKTFSKSTVYPSKGVRIVSQYDLTVSRWGHSESEVGKTIALLYAPIDNLTIYMLLDNPQRLFLPLTVQKGNIFNNASGVFLRESHGVAVWRSPVIWSMNATDTNIFMACLQSKGWYTFSVGGPIDVDSSGCYYSRDIGYRRVNDTIQWVDEFAVNLTFKLLQDKTPILFAIDEYGGMRFPPWIIG